MAKVRQRKRDMVEHGVARHIEMFKKTGAEPIMGAERFVAPKMVEVRRDGGATRLIAAERIFLDPGSHAAMPSVPGLAAAQPLTHIEGLAGRQLASRQYIRHTRQNSRKPSASAGHWVTHVTARKV